LGQIGNSFWASDFKIELDLVPTMMKVYANFGASTVSRSWVMVLTNKQTDWGTNNWNHSQSDTFENFQKSSNEKR
jgi:hypothetical protein